MFNRLAYDHQFLTLLGSVSMVRAALGGGKKPGISSTSRVWTMSDDTRGRGAPDGRSADKALSARLRHLGERLDKISPARPSDAGPASGPAADPSAIARGIRASTEVVAGVLVGAGLGWLLDRWLGTLPWGMFVLALLGFTAGVFNVVRTARAGPVPQGTPHRDDR